MKCLPKIHVYPEPQNTALLRNRVRADVISYNEAVLEEGGPYSNERQPLTKQRHTD